MAHFTNQFDKIATELGSSVIYCHHHSKGSQGNKKSMDRASGSGVFARDPDALMDLVELEISPELASLEKNKVHIRCMEETLKKYNPAYFTSEVSLDHLQSSFQMKQHVKLAGLTDEQLREMNANIIAGEEIIKHESAWRIEGTLREFPSFDPVNVWFRYPIHIVDGSDVLKDISLDDDLPHRKGGEANKKTQAEKKKDKLDDLLEAFDYCKNDEGIARYGDLKEYLGVKSTNTIKTWVEDSDKLEIKNKAVVEITSND
jgi:RecA-family ATPase